MLPERDELNERWLGIMQQYALTEADTSPAAAQARARLRAERISVADRLQAVDDRLAREFPDYFALIKPQPLDVAAAQRLLGPDQAILLTVRSEFGTPRGGAHA